MPVNLTVPWEHMPLHLTDVFHLRIHGEESSSAEPFHDRIETHPADSVWPVIWDVPGFSNARIGEVFGGAVLVCQPHPSGPSGADVPDSDRAAP
jgi:hypothetical protein